MPASPEAQVAQQDPDTPTRIGGWLFKHRTSLPLPIVVALLLIPADADATDGRLWFAVGAAVVIAGELIRLWGVHHIGAISRTRAERLGPLIDSGPFAHVRNPLYVGNILLWLGFTISARLLWLTPVVLLLLALEYHAIVRWEERLLESRMGQVYREYLERVPRWIPRLSAGSRGTQTAQTSAFAWSTTLFSERGTLIAIVAGFLLLALKP